MRWLVVAALALAACTGDQAPQAHAQRVGALEETIGGPHAIGRVGDYLLENDQIRLIIADVGPGRVNLPFGGSLVDADLVRPGGAGHGNDQLAELLPGFMFVGLNPTSITIDNDGTDGNAAVVTVHGTGNDLLQMVGLLDQGLVGPANLDLEQTYRLHPGQRYVEIDTTVKNTSTGEHPFPFLDPTQLDDLGFAVPGIENLQLSAPMGQLPLLGGEQDLFAPGQAGFNVHFAIEDSYALAKGFPAFPGMVVDFLASRGPGVSYGLTVPQASSNYVNAFANLYANQPVSPYSMLIPFTYAGVSAVFMANPPATLGPQEQFTFTSYFVIGKGDVSSVLDTIYQIRNTATGTFGGSVVDAQTEAPLAGASVLVLDGSNDPIDQMTTDSGGAFLGHLAPGSYSYQVIANDRLRPDPVPFTVAAGAQTGVLIQVAPTARIAVSAIDELGRHAPAKILLVGQFAPQNAFPVDPRTFLYSLKLGEKQRTTAFDGTTGFVEGAWWTVDGRLDATVRPGDYDLYVSRGPEYEVHKEHVTIAAGSFQARQVQLQRAYSSDGWVAGDFHLHAAPSTDSGLPIATRVATCAAEGLDVAAATDHNFVTDYAPTIASSGLDGWLVGIPGMELTTFEMGHFIGYPLKVDPGSTRGGEFVWAGHPPQDLFDQLHTTLAGGERQGLVTIAHPRQAVLGYFAQFFIDQATAQTYTPTGLLGVFAPYGSEFSASNFSYDFDAIELITGNHFEDIHNFVAPNPLPPGPFPDPQPVPGQVVIGKDGRPTFPGTVETWFAMLDRGLQPTGMGASDAHHTLGDEPGYARTFLFVGHGKDTPGGYTQADVVAAIRAHHAVASNAPLIEMTLGTAISGDTIAHSGPAAVQIHVSAPSWAQPDTLTVYTNGGAIVATIPITNTPGAPTDFTTTVTLTPTTDSWVVAEATGAMNMFPINSATELPPLDATVIIQALSIGLDLSSLPITSNLKPSRTHFSHPYAITNPIRIDVDGNGWTPPQAPIPMNVVRGGKRGKAPDVRAQFDALPEWNP
nr:CehA/McbA family metallohydrolase [Kofleriaceae bacterium]